MTAILVHRLELSGSRDLDLDADLLHWLAEHAGMGQSEIWLRHTRGLVGDLSGAFRMLDDLFPAARWTIGKRQAGASFAFGATLILPGTASPFTGYAVDPANALLAATLRAFAAIGARLAANDKEIAA
ncbi:hypothetical protein [Aureimonas phyllosphaerae]|uniref:Uncharacterized protein n=1 Tax=Aureimonas phyllosphaerae TaxID=1166078 RepID=A0A7W6C1T3_9HYPH|nr:hypothetical protein [Aureimonas phyllosphaerae]MBB3937916.1 hypothetical protein [Aureimonas phyllosphaerae]MBB3961911.1 hypothetical protein [Aureimonas phyllosphaerae]SFF54637.1 hypothetical protein SAMN05216566_12538 [Aureimonas phyllosphaerae]